MTIKITPPRRIIRKDEWRKMKSIGMANPKKPKADKKKKMLGSKVKHVCIQQGTFCI